ncbi:hypothetical protein LINGRAHAP2_LOCUS5889 [Linum grandiflorum]
MAATSTTIYPLPPIPFSSKPTPQSSLLFLPPPVTTSSLSTLSLSISPSHRKPHTRRNRLTLAAAVEAAPPADIVAPLEEIVVPDDGVGTVISTLLLIAFVILSVLTIGVIYIAVTDFLQKREGEKFNKEEEEKQKKRKGKERKLRARSRAGPRGFGQKVAVDEDDELDD